MPTKPDADPKVTRRQSENIRAQIASKAGATAARLQAHVDGKIDLTPAQVRSAGILLSKVVADQKEIHQETSSPYERLSKAELYEKLGDVLATMPADKLGPLLEKLGSRLPGGVPVEIVSESMGKLECVGNG